MEVFLLFYFISGKLVIVETSKQGPFTAESVEVHQWMFCVCTCSAKIALQGHQVAEYSLDRLSGSCSAFQKPTTSWGLL